MLEQLTYFTYVCGTICILKIGVCVCVCVRACVYIYIYIYPICLQLTQQSIQAYTQYL